jgi:predicted GNAT family N-acyltransferase
MTTVKVVESESELKACQTIRIDVFVHGQGVPAELELDEYEDECIHFVAVQDSQPIGTGRLRDVDDLFVKFERVRASRSSVEANIHVMRDPASGAEQGTIAGAKVVRACVAIHHIDYT